MQLSLFGAEAAEPRLEDLDGLLLAGGDWVRTERGAAARLSVLVDQDWRAAALRAELGDRGMSSDTAPAPGELMAVRTEITERLSPHAGRWTKGASLRPPVDLTLMAMADPDDALRRAAGAQLAKLGVAAVDVGSRIGPGWRVTSVKRLRRLAELIGSPPAGCGRDWPAG